jgi:hypothetical protein
MARCSSCGWPPAAARAGSALLLHRGPYIALAAPSRAKAYHTHTPCCVLLCPGRYSPRCAAHRATAVLQPWPLLTAPPAGPWLPQALVDFLVLISSRAFVGLGSSTFSVYTREHRVMRGHKRGDDVFVDTSKIGTDALFERTTHFARLDLDPTAMFNRWK